MAFSYVNIPNTPERTGLSRRDGKRPYRLTLLPWSNSTSVTCNVTVIDTVVNSYLSLSSVTVGPVADQVERSKHNEYIDLKANNHFTPFEAFSCVDLEATNYLSKLETLMFRVTGEIT